VNQSGKIKIVIIGLIIIVVCVVVGIMLLNSDKEVNISTANELQEYFYMYSLDDMVGIIDNKGKVIIEPKYMDLYMPNPTRDVFICFDDEEYVILNSEGKEILADYKDVSVVMISEANLEIEKDVLKYEEDGLYGLIDLSGNKLTDAIYEKISSLTNKSGFLLVRKDGLYGIVDSNGKVVIDTKYNSIRGDRYNSEKDGYAKTGYVVSEKTDTGIFYGYIDYKYNVILPVKYEEIIRVLAYEEEDIYLVVRSNGRRGVFKNKKQIIKNDFQVINYSSSSKIFVVQKAGKYGFNDISGREILKPEYTSYSIAGNYISVKIDSRMMLYDVYGNLVNSNNYKSVTDTGNPEYFIAENEQGYYSVISKGVKVDDEYISLKYAFDDYFIFTNKENKSGLLNVWSGAIIEPEYDYIIVIDRLNALEARKINEDEEYVVDIYSKDIEKILTINNPVIENVKEVYAVVYSDSEIRYINENGNIVPNTEVYPDLKLYTKEEDGKWGFCDHSGKIVVECIYDIVTPFNKYGFAGVKKDEKWGVVDDVGTIIVEPIHEMETYIFPKFIGPYELIEGRAVFCLEIE